MQDIFDNQILCNNCNVKMQKTNIERNGFVMRAIVCPKCHSRLIHPADEAEYEKFINLKKKEFHVKMRLVGNSYTVSIPREIVSFMEQQKELMDNMVRLCFQDRGRLSLNFGAGESEEATNASANENKNARVVKAREYKVIKNNKPVLHIRQFADSANPKNNKTQIFKNPDKN